MRISNARIDGKGAFLIWSNIFVDVMDSTWLVDSKNELIVPDLSALKSSKVTNFSARL